MAKTTIKTELELGKDRIISLRQVGWSVTLFYALLGCFLILIPEYQSTTSAASFLGDSLRDWVYLAVSSTMVYFLAQYFTRKLIQGEYRVSLGSAESEIVLAQRLAGLQLTTETILSSSTQGIFVLDANGRVTFVNQAVCKMLGFEEGELVGESHHAKVLHHHVDGAPYPIAQCPLYNALRQGVATQGEEAYICKDGSLLPIEFSCNPLWDAGVMRGAVVFFKDISERLANESRLRVHSTVFESMMEGVAVTDADVNILSVNPAFTHITGFKPEEVLGRNPKIMKSGRHDKEFYRRMWESIDLHGSWSGEIWNRRKSGKVQPEWLNITRVSNQAGETTHYVASFIDTSAIKASEEQLHHLAHHDNLTGLPNRLLFYDRLDQSFKRARRQQRRVAVLFLDLDDFKKINDTLGHQVGDELLKQAAQRIKALLRKGDTVARLGGDEFIILIDRLEKPEDASLVAIKVLSTLKQPFKIVGRELFIGVSIGISIFPQDGEETDTLVKNADVSMYRAKQQGKNNFQFYTEALSQKANHKMEQEADLRKALEMNQFLLFYQPQVLLSNGRVVSAEALLYWQHPELGLIHPSQFIPLAEETGLILPIGEWALREACRQASAWDRDGISGLRIAVNISIVQIQRIDLFELVQSVVQESGLQPNRLELEITENCIMGRTGRNVEVLNRLKAIGVGISIADFGAGYSSLQYLQQLPVDRLKLGRSFLEGVPQNRANSLIASAIASMGEKFGIPLVAEGVEAEEQMHFAREIGCQIGQGSICGEAYSPERFVEKFHVN